MSNWSNILTEFDSTILEIYKNLQRAKNLELKLMAIFLFTGFFLVFMTSSMSASLSTHQIYAQSNDADETSSTVQNTENSNLPASGQTVICNPSSATLRITDKGPEVTNLQNILIQLGYPVGPTGADGDFGKDTQAAVIKFQQDKQLEKIDGEVGPETWNALCSLLSSPTTTPGSPTTTPGSPTTTPGSPTTTPGSPTTTPGSPTTQPGSTTYVKCTRPGDDATSLKAFINNPQASTLDFLPKNKCLEYRDLKWDYYDYPGGAGRPLTDSNGKPVTDKYGNTKEPEGPNEEKAKQMVGNLKIVNPERRATVEEGGVPAGTAVLCVRCDRTDPHIFIVNEGTSQKRTISPELWSWIKTELSPVQGHDLNKHAATAFENMRKEAEKDGINLVILSGQGAAFREKTASDTGCTRAANVYAVACFPNSHNLGLAVDLKMSNGNQQYQEATTLGKNGMQNVVDMRQSPVHKWLFLNAAKFGFYPYTHEPWHWEYNPPDFSETFFAGAPPR
jgi:peptidoglycan hydrolase-like protein with peptidoglycan-binding domain